MRTTAWRRKFFETAKRRAVRFQARTTVSVDVETTRRGDGLAGRGAAADAGPADDWVREAVPRRWIDPLMPEDLPPLEDEKALAASKHPLALFLDDLQWADLPSIELLADVRHGLRRFRGVDGDAHQQPVGQHARAACNGREVAARFTHHGRGFAGDGGFVD